MILLSLDTETTGLDLYHGCLPYCVVAARLDTETDVVTEYCWLWPVQQWTRKVLPFLEDLDHITGMLVEADQIVLQNSKFDYTALTQLWEVAGHKLHWDWDRVQDTLLAGHLLASNQPHNLTDMALHYLGVDISGYETALHKETEAARRKARSLNRAGGENMLRWRIADSNLPDMPTAKGSLWKADGWLPAQLARHLDYPAVHPWHNVLTDYAQADAACTLQLWLVMEQQLHQRRVWDLYQQRLKVLPIAAGMEAAGVTVSVPRLTELQDKFQQEATQQAMVCTTVMEELGTEPFPLPKTGNSAALRSFIFDVLRLPTRKRSKNTGAPSISKDVLEAYEHELEAGSPGHRFVQALRAKRKRDTALSYLEAYQRYGLPHQQYLHQFLLLHPNLNPTGTDTLRCSSSNPNAQNISKQEDFGLRSCFGPVPGREWWSLDAQNIELRLPAYEAGEEEMIALFEEPTKPPYYGSNHLLNFHTVYPELWEQELAEHGLDKVGPAVKKKYASTYYQWAKNGGFAVQYGAIERDGGVGTADRAFHRAGSHARLKQRFRAIHGKGGLNDRCIKYAEKYGYIETMPDSSVDPARGYPLLCTRTQEGRILPTVPLNYRVQGTACWWMMQAMIRVQAQLDKWDAQSTPGNYRIVMQIHDELVLEFPRSRVHPKLDNGLFRLSNLWRVRIVQQLMAQGGADLIYSMGPSGYNSGKGVPTPVGVEYHAEHWGKGDTF